MTVSLCLIAALSSTSLPAHTRAMWVWHGHTLVQNAAQRHAFFEFLEAPKGDSSARISVVFVSRLGVEDEGQTGAIGDFVARAHQHSVRVDYLCGEANYVTPEHWKEGLWQTEYVLQYNKRVSRNCRFDGIQYDVEPYALRGWPSQLLTHEYLAFLSSAKAAIRKSGEHVKLGAAIPRWFDGPDLHGLYKSVLNRVDYVAVMDYVDRSSSFVKDAANTVQYASSSGKKVWLGAEASKLPDEPTATFYSLGNAAMESAFHAAYQAYGSTKGFAGVAVEYYETYEALKH